MQPKKLYRFISLESFIELLVLNEEVYTLPSKWKDSYEGCALQFIDKEENRRRFINALVSQYRGSDHFVNAIVDNYVKAEVVRCCSFAQCWSYKEESDALWNKYGIGNHAIQIASDTNRISKNLVSQKQNFRIEKIKYDIDENDEPGDFIRFYQVGKDFQDQLFHKRKAFKEEGEHRVLITKDYSVLFNSRLNEYRHGLVEQLNSGNDLTVESIIETINKVNDLHPVQLESTLKVKVEDVSKYIKSVRVHPDAEPWYVDFIKELCSIHNVRFENQSPLYRKF